MSISNHFDALPEMTDDEAIALIIAIKRTHNFVGTVFTPRDVRDHLREYHFAEEDGREPTDAEMDAVFATWEWRKGMADILCERGWEVLNDAIFDALNPDA